MKKKCYNEECDWEVTYVTLRVCLCVYVAECMRVCAFYLVCVLQNPQTFFFFCFFLGFFFNCVITRFLTPRLKKKPNCFTSPMNIISE